MTIKQRRLKLFAAHLGISSIILIVLMYLIFYKWYPHNLFFTSGGWQGTKIVFFVDMVLGPLLTLILVTPTKRIKELIRDLFCCGLLQICALSYGVALIVNNKPIALSIHNGIIYTISKDDIKNLPDKTVFFSSKQKPPLFYSEDASRYDISNPELMQKARTMMNFSQEFRVPMHAVPSIFDDIENRKGELAEITTRSLQDIKENELYDERTLQKMTQENWHVVPIDGSFIDGYMAFDNNGSIKDSICCH